MTTDVAHRPEQHRFEVSVDGHSGHLAYAEGGKVLTIVHTEVDPALEGRGLAGALVRAAVDHARTNGLRVKPTCAYAASYMQRHPELMSTHV
ncbi:MAG: GNAT family N-acetyltransferase [Caldimonas sp.]